MATVYILHSKTKNRFYIGSCANIQLRLKQHSTNYFENSYTSNNDDWELFLALNNLESRQARLMESHIKKMKSKKYIYNLKKYVEMQEKLKTKFINT